jgi:hypothetical protein
MKKTLLFAAFLSLSFTVRSELVYGTDQPLPAQVNQCQVQIPFTRSTEMFPEMQWEEDGTPIVGQFLFTFPVKAGHAYAIQYRTANSTVWHTEYFVPAQGQAYKGEYVGVMRYYQARWYRIVTN